MVLYNNVIIHLERMISLNYLYLVDTKGMTPEDRKTVESHMEKFGEVFTTPHSTRGVPPRYFVITKYTPEQFSSFTHPENFPWQDVAGWDLNQL